MARIPHGFEYRFRRFSINANTITAESRGANVGAMMIIVVDDRESIAAAYSASFEREGVAAAALNSADFREWVGHAAHQELEAVSGFVFGDTKLDCISEVCVLRRMTAPVIALKDARSLPETLEAFAHGFDDVVAKPCHAREILARIGAISKRRERQVSAAQVDDDIVIFNDGRDPLVCGRPLNLPRRELRILEYLAQRRGRRVSKSQIFNAVYGIFEQDIDENVIESHISKLRRRLRQELGYDPIESRRHLGYRLAEKSARISGRLVLRI